MKPNFDLICYSHLRWNFVFQRPQHLLTRCNTGHKVYFVEEPLHEEKNELRVEEGQGGVTVVTPIIDRNLSSEEQTRVHRRLLEDYLKKVTRGRQFVEWYYTPMGLDWVDLPGALCVVYDCMDELSQFKGASPRLKQREKDLFAKADLVFTGGVSLYEHKKSQHRSVYAFPSSVDVKHFAEARVAGQQEPEDQAHIPHPRAGFFGVIDERFDIELLDQVATLRPNIHFVMIGPVVKIDPEILPRRDNIHYLGGKTYADLPKYIAGWDIALLPFARNESTQFISPTKTPEYLAAGRPVVSTSIKDVVSPYGDLGLVHIANAPADFAAACDACLSEENAEWLAKVDDYVGKLSWDNTWRMMAELIYGEIETKSTGAQAQKVGETGAFHV